jgi:hypothetical protein
MSKILAVMIAGLFAAGAYAQQPPNSEAQVITNTPQQQKAEAKVDARPQGMVKKPVGDEANNAEVNPINNSKTGNRAQAKVDSKAQGMVKATGGDESKSAEQNPIAQGKTATAADAGIARRNARAAAKKKAKMDAAAATN